MKIVVTTPTGNVGAHIVPLLVQAGERPTLLVRDAAKLAAEVRATTEVVELDQGDRDADNLAARLPDAVGRPARHRRGRRRSPPLDELARASHAGRARTG